MTLVQLVPVRSPGPWSACRKRPAVRPLFPPYTPGPLRTALVRAWKSDSWLPVSVTRFPGRKALAVRKGRRRGRPGTPLLPAGAACAARPRRPLRHPHRACSRKSRQGVSDIAWLPGVGQERSGFMYNVLFSESGVSQAPRDNGRIEHERLSFRRC